MENDTQNNITPQNNMWSRANIAIEQMLIEIDTATGEKKEFLIETVNLLKACQYLQEAYQKRDTKEGQDMMDNDPYDWDKAIGLDEEV